MELLEIGVKMRKGVFFVIRRCFRSVCDHPFLVGVLCFFIFLYRSSPFIFSLLMSASPVLVCTAVLLGALLSFGQPNIPEMEREEKTSHEVVSVKMGISRDATVIDKNESYYGEKKREEGKQVRKLGDVHRKDSLDDTAPLIDARLTEIQMVNVEIWEANRELGVNEDRLSYEEARENRYSSIPKMNNDEPLQSDYEKSEADSFDSERVNVDSLDSPPRSPWKRVDDREEEEDEEDEENDALESGSDMAESSSPDASMADIMPMLDELHPLLDEDTPQPDHMSHEGSDVGSESSPKSSMSSDESDEGSENNKDLEVADEDNEDGEDEDDVQGNEQEQMKSAITWTEEDQKNLMDLGSSEIERNQRLENLILRRRARKNVSMVPERNLIDLESFDLGFNIAPISTARKNPFGLPRDSYDNMGLPPIPGSAPTILLARQNPFDIPYDSSEEKPDLMGDGFQEEFTTVQSRGPFFWRHESFSVGSSIFAPAKQERQNAKLRPYFVPEQMASEESSYSLFQRQSSELSDSKVSSVPETESIGSVEDMVERRVSEEDNPAESEAIIGTKEATKESSSGDPELISEREDIPEEDTPGEPALISTMEHVSEHVGHGSQSSEEDEPLKFGQIEKRDVEQDEHGFQLGDAEDHYEERAVAKSLEVHVTGFHPSSETVEQVNSKGSSSLSFSEVNERVLNETEGKLSMLEGRSDGFAEDPGISTQTSIGSDLSVTLVEGMPLRDPIYDSSPPADRKNALSFMSSDVHIESDLGLPPVLVKQMLSYTERESKGSNAEMDVHSNIEMSPKSSKSNYVIEHGSGQIDVVLIREHDNVIFDSPKVEQRSSSSVKASVEENPIDHHIQGQIPGSSFDKNIQGVVEYSEDKSQVEEEKHLPIAELHTVEISAPLMEGWLTVDHSLDEENTAESPAIRKNVSSLMSSDAHIESDLLPPELVKKMVSVTETESEGSSLEMNLPSNFEISPESAMPHSVIEHEFDQIDVVEIREHEDEIFYSCRVEQRLSSSVEASVEENIKDHHTQSQFPTSSSCGNTNGVVKSSEDQGQLEEEKYLVVSEQHTVKIPMPLMQGRLAADHSISKEGTSQSPNSDADVYHEANEKLISTPAEGNVSFFDGSTIHERTYEHVNEVQVPNTPVGSFEERQRIQILNIDELDQKISENLNSPLIPDFVSIPSMPSGAASPHVEMRTIIEDDEIMDIDEELLSELDSVGDFTVKKWGPASDEFEKHEIVACAPHDETSTLRVGEVNPFETSKIENAIHSNSKEEIDVHEDLECISELQIRDTGIAESIDVSNEEFDGRDAHDSPDQKMTQENSIFSEGYEDMRFGISRVDTEVIKDADLLAKKDELASLETEARDGPPEPSPYVDIHTTSIMPETEARTTEDVGLMFKKTDDKEIEESVVSYQPHSDLVTGETIGEQGMLQVKMGVTHEMPVIDIRPVEDATLDHKQVNCVTTGNRVLHESEDHRLHVIGVRQTQGISSDLHVARAISPEGTSLRQKLVLDGNIEEQLKLKTNDGPAEVKADKANMSLNNEPTVDDIRSADTRKSDHNVEVCEDVQHSTESTEGKGKISKSSSSSSSSSSESSSSDSDRE